MSEITRTCNSGDGDSHWEGRQGACSVMRSGRARSLSVVSVHSGNDKDGGVRGSLLLSFTHCMVC